MDRLLSDAKLSRAELAIAIKLVGLSSKHGYTIASHKYIAKLTGCTTRTVVRSVEKLVRFGYFKVKPNPGGRNNYEPCFKDASSFAEEPAYYDPDTSIRHGGRKRGVIIDNEEVVQPEYEPRDLYHRSDV